VKIFVKNKKGYYDPSITRIEISRKNSRVVCKPPHSPLSGGLYGIFLTNLPTSFHSATLLIRRDNVRPDKGGGPQSDGGFVDLFFFLLPSL